MPDTTNLPKNVTIRHTGKPHEFADYVVTDDGVARWGSMTPTGPQGSARKQ